MTKKSRAVASAATETFVPAVTFDGYPDGRAKVAFRAGVTSIPVPKEFVALMRRKGLVAAESTEDTK